MPRKLIIRFLTAITATFVIVGAPAALAQTDSGDDDTVTTTADQESAAWEFGKAGPMEYAFDATKGVLRLNLSNADGDTPDRANRCIPTDTLLAGDQATADTVDTGVDSDARPKGCLEIDITGPQGQINHGSVVSNSVHALKEIRDELDLPFGHYIREIAKSDLGKRHADETDGASSGDADRSGDADSGKGKKNGNGGPPEHSNAGGNGGGRGKK